MSLLLSLKTFSGYDSQSAGLFLEYLTNKNLKFDKAYCKLAGGVEKRRENKNMEYSRFCTPEVSDRKRG